MRVMPILCYDLLDTFRRQLPRSEFGFDCENFVTGGLDGSRFAHDDVAGGGGYDAFVGPERGRDGDDVC